jgi:hypothetical protein
MDVWESQVILWHLKEIGGGGEKKETFWYEQTHLRFHLSYNYVTVKLTNIHHRRSTGLISPAFFDILLLLNHFIPIVQSEYTELHCVKKLKS